MERLEYLLEQRRRDDRVAFAVVRGGEVTRGAIRMINRRVPVLRAGSAERRFENDRRFADADAGDIFVSAS